MMKRTNKLLAVFTAVLMLLGVMGGALAQSDARAVSALDEALNVVGGNIHFTSEGYYPWLAVSSGGRTYAMSGNTGVGSSKSELTAVVTAVKGNVVRFEFKARGEGSDVCWDHCDFAVDGVVVFSYGARDNDWEVFSYSLSAGTHTLTWSYTKDPVVNAEGDYFAIDNVFVGNLVGVNSINATEHLDILKNRTGNITWSVLPASASNKAVTLTSADPAVAAVNSDGTVLGISAGETSIVIASVEDPSVFAVCGVTVTDTGLDMIHHVIGVGSAYNAAPGSTVSVPVTISGSDYLAHVLTLHLAYDPEYLTVQSVAAGPVWNALPDDAMTVLDTSSVAGDIGIGIVCPSEGFSGLGTLVTVTFAVSPDCLADQRISVYDEELSYHPVGGSSSPIDVFVQEGLICMRPFTVTYTGAYTGTDEAPYGGSVTLPVLETPGMHYTFTVDGEPWDGTNITGDVTVYVGVAEDIYTVTFIDPITGTVIAERTTGYGGTVTAPAAPEHEDYVFVGWSADFSYVTGDMTVTAIYSYIGSALLPGDVDGDGMVTFTDISVLYGYLLGKNEIAPEYMQNADFDGDGTVSFIDVGSMYYYCLGGN